MIKVFQNANPNVSILYHTPILVSETKTGKYKYWQAVAYEKNNLHYTLSMYTQSNVLVSVGKETWNQTITFSEPVLITSKNVGKANETSTADQAVAEVKSAGNLKKDKGYNVLGNLVTTQVLLPMLAEKYETRKGGIGWTEEVYVQPKLDGVRCLLTSSGTISRGGKSFIPEIFNGLEFLASSLGNVILDGELILVKGGKMQPLQDTVKAVKKYRPDFTDHVVYIAYDVVDTSKTFTDRLAILETFKALQNTNFQICPTKIVRQEAEIYSAHFDYVLEGYEGTMVRANLVRSGSEVGYYLPGKRSISLLKVKEFLEEEFKVVDILEGVGKFKGLGVLVLETSAGNTFNAVPIGTAEERSSIWKNRNKVIGEKWTVRFQAYTKDGIPQFPRAICRRDYE